MNISSIKTNSADSPKTPGGIRKSLLTPCRRVGLSRKWKKSGVSPFISPLGGSSSNKEVKQDNEVKKRKCNSEEEEEDLGKNSSEEISSETCNKPKIEIDRTPTRTLLPRKRSKTLLTTRKCQEVEKEPQNLIELSDKNIVMNDKADSTEEVSKEPNLVNNDENVEEESVKQVSKLSRKNSKSSNKIKILESPVKNVVESSRNDNRNLDSINNVNLQNKDINVKVSVKEKSPNNLTKECMVVIQKRIFKTDQMTDTLRSNMKENVTKGKSASQSLFDSDSDDVPLSDLNKPDNESKIAKNDSSEQITQIRNVTNDRVVENTPKHKETNDAVQQNPQNIIIDLTNKDSEDSDFVETKKDNTKKLEKPTRPHNKTKEKPKTTKLLTKSIPKPSQQSSNLCDEDDDFDYGRSKTILIKKTYDKVPKLSKAKSTGSITQKDIDDITARIESKKNLLLAKAMTTETRELRELIKKWQVGCQTALMELLDLMRKKLPDQNMEQSELLQMLKIPPDLVGYDSDSDSFNTPDDAAIILSALKLN